MDAIAREAGVGNATMYRNFPTKEDILAAVLQGVHEGMGRRAEALLDSHSAGDAFVEWLAEFLEHTQSLLGLPDPVLAAMDDESSALYGSCAKMRASSDELYARAQCAGDLRRDVLVDDVYAHALGIAWATEGSADKRERARRLLAVFVEGLRQVDD